MFKRLLIIGVLLGILIFTVTCFPCLDEYQREGARQHYITKGYEETGSRNLVAAIYLDYRLFDSIFEAGILLISATGILFMIQKNQ